jgi:hypothetical protein
LAVTEAAEALELAVAAVISEARVSAEWAVAAFGAEWADLSEISRCDPRQWDDHFRDFARRGNFTRPGVWFHEISHA